MWIDTQEGASYHYTNFPVHLSLPAVFATAKTGAELAEGLSELLANTHPVEIEADEEAMYGVNQDIAVMKVKKTSGLMNIYNLVYEWLEEIGVTYNSPQYEGEGYGPHSTYQPTGRLNKGEKKILKSVSLIDMFPGGDGEQRKIFKTVALL